MRILVTGGCGFIGSTLIRKLLEKAGISVLNVDKLTYSSSLESVADVSSLEGYKFAQVDICDRIAIRKLFSQFRPNAVMHLAAESHVDRSIDSPEIFVKSNILGTFELLEAARAYCDSLPEDSRARFRMLHVSTDEVFGDLGDDGDFTEESPYAPSSPYSASKASSDHLVRAWGRTYGLPVIITNCSNNYGPFQFPEKLIPTMILNAVQGRSLPVYGDGEQIRDWLHVEDHARALIQILSGGRPGETYNVGGNCRQKNIDVVRAICSSLDASDAEKPSAVASFSDLISFVTDRPGHDRRYAINNNKISAELGWHPQYDFEGGLRQTVHWYLDNLAWCESVGGMSLTKTRRGLIS